MKFGKLLDISMVDFRLPPDPPELGKIHEKGKGKEGPAKVYIGCTGWSMKEWVGKVYPNGTKSADYLRHYSRQFNTIELNTTHYRIPAPSVIDKWRTESAPDFRFCPKILQQISHSRDLGLGSHLTTEFCTSIAGLGEKLGCCFIQLPPYFGVQQAGTLERFIRSFPRDLPLAIEFRHESWFEQGGLDPSTEWMQRAGMSTVLTDVAGRRDVLHMRLTSPRVLIRFVGNSLHPTDFSRIDEWVERLSKWISAGLREVYFFIHEPDNLLAPDLSLYLHEKLNGVPNIELRGPTFLDGQDPQMSLF